MSFDIDEIEKAAKIVIESHMIEQPYKITCADCGTNLEVYKSEVDKDMDLTIQITACADCIKNERQEAVDEYKLSQE